MNSSFSGMDPRGLISRHFIDSTQSRDLAVNGSVTPVVFRVAPLPGECWIIRSMLIYGLSSGGSVGNELFVDLAALTNGLTFQFGSGDDVFALHDRDPSNPDTSLFPIKTNLDFSLLVGFTIDLDVEGTDAIRASWDISLSGAKIRVKGARGTAPHEAGEYLQLVVRDDLSSLGGFYVSVLGHREVA